MTNSTIDMKQFRQEYINHAYKAAALVGIEAPPSSAFRRHVENLTYQSYRTIASSVIKGLAGAEPSWLDPVLGFERFVVDLGPRPLGHGLARIDTSKPWGPFNAGWVEREQYSSSGRPPRSVVEVRRWKREALAREYGLSESDLERRQGSWLYSTWSGMVSRCNNPASKKYENYGGRGIKIFEDWDNGSTVGFEVFAAYVLLVLGPRPEGCSLDRIDNDGDYEPGNLRWATVQEQLANKRQDTEAQKAVRDKGLKAAHEAQAKAAQERRSRAVALAMTGATNPEIAQALGCHPGSVARLLRSACERREADAALLDLVRATAAMKRSSLRGGGA